MSLGAPVKEIVNCRCTTIPFIEETTLDPYAQYDDKLAPDGPVNYDNLNAVNVKILPDGPGAVVHYNTRQLTPEQYAEYLEVTSKKSSEIFGKQISTEEILRIAGVPGGIKGTAIVTYEKDGKTIKVTFLGDGVDSIVRRIRVLQNGKLSLENSEFILEPDARGKGIGLSVFRQQVYFARQNGVSEITTLAAKRTSSSELGSMNGYYTWARFGYNTALSEPITIGGVTANTMNELMKIPGGAEFWQQNGYEFNGTFNLTNGSDSMNVFTSYIDERNKRGQKSIALGSDTDIELTELDEQILNSVWLAK